MPFKSKAQQRYMFAAEARGELPKGTARQWAHETKNISALPEHVKKKKSMKKQAEDGMFFKAASEEAPADGMFFKNAKLDLPIKKEEPEPLPLKPPKAESSPLPKLEKKPEDKFKLPDRTEGSTPKMGHGCMGKQGMLGIPGSEGAADGSGSEMGVGKPAKKKLEKKADAVEDAMETGKKVINRAGEVGGKVVGGAKKALGDIPEYANRAAKGIENLPPWAHLALLGGGGLLGLRSLGRGIKGVAGAVRRKPVPEGFVARFKNLIRGK